MKVFFSFSLLLGFFQVNAQANTLRVQSAEVNFTIKNAGITVNGYVSGITANIRWSDDSSDESSIEAKTDVNTLKTGIQARDRHLMKEDYFHVISFPEMSLKSKSIKKNSYKDYQGIFTLKIKNTTREVEIPFVKQNGIFTGNFSINRLDYGIGESSWILSDDVNISFKVICQTP